MNKLKWPEFWAGLLLVLAIMGFIVGCGCVGPAAKGDPVEPIKYTIIVYDAQGNVARTYEDVEHLIHASDGFVKFDWHGERHVIFNTNIELIKQLTA